MYIPLYSSSLAESTASDSGSTEEDDLADLSSRLLLMKLMMSSFVLSPSYCDKLPFADLKYSVGKP